MSPRSRRKTRHRRTARTADRHDLYQRSVQTPEEDARRLARRFQVFTGETLRSIREDFCGTAALSCAFIWQNRANRAVGVDLDPATLAWGREHNVSFLDEEQRSRLTLVKGDVRTVRCDPVDLVAAFNFSYSVFHTRRELKKYFEHVTTSLRKGGVFVVDIWGGGDVFTGQIDRRRRGGFNYVWDHNEFSPITHRATCRIHFEFPDGTRMRDAFVYDWRIWTIPEIVELFEEVGFRDVHVLWEGTDAKSGGGSGVFRRDVKGEMLRSYVAYIAGRWDGSTPARR